MTLYNFIKNSKDATCVFGSGEIRILKKQLLGINLTQSEKNRLSRSIRPKLKFIADCSLYKDEFEVKKGKEVYNLLDVFKDEILKDKFSKKIITIYLFGSFIENKMSMDSDIDVAVEFDNISKKDASEFKMRIIPNISNILQLTIFNQLPDNIKKEIFENGRVYYKNK
jgi:predicted nucleotidyltransferase